MYHSNEDKIYSKIADIPNIFTTIISVIANEKSMKDFENKSRTGAPRKISPKSIAIIQGKIQEDLSHKVLLFTSEK